MSDPRPYLNPNNGERTSFPHAVSVFAPRNVDEWLQPAGVEMEPEPAVTGREDER